MQNKEEEEKIHYTDNKECITEYKTINTKINQLDKLAAKILALQNQLEDLEDNIDTDVEEYKTKWDIDLNIIDKVVFVKHLK